MRLLSRHAPVEELDSSPTMRQAEPKEVPPKAQKLLGEKPRLYMEEIMVNPRDYAPGDNMAIPPKAQKILGEKGQVKHSRTQDMKHKDPDSFWSIRDAEQKSLGTFRGSEADSDTIPGAKRGARLPNVPIPKLRGDDFSVDSTSRTGTTTHYPGHQQSTESMSREYYDASKQPLYVSQQTSESSVRDMALHRGVLTALPVSETSSETNLIARPLKTAFRNRRPETNRTASDGPRKERKLDLGSFLPHPKTSAGIMSPRKSTRSQPPTKENSDSFAQHTMYAQVARQVSKLRLETERNAKPLPKEPVDPSVGRVKVFESDIYDSKKTNVYRPPKGVKNWFDGLDISSDEEDPEPANFPAVELPANEVPKVQEALPSVFSPYGTPMREFTGPTLEGPERKAADTAPPPRRSKEAMRRRMRAKNSQSSANANSPSSGVVEDRTRGGESRLAHSRLEAQSVLSLSSDSGGEETLSPIVRARPGTGGSDAVVIEKASPMEMQKPPAPPRKLDGPPTAGPARRASSALQQSKAPEEKLADETSPPRVLSRGTGSVMSGSSVAATRKASDQQESPAQSPPKRWPTHSSYERDGSRSAGDETTSSLPTNGSRLMAVTEEEMMLLELMRQKRAAMQKDSFSEGYRVALQEEGRAISRGQESIHDHALMNLGKRDMASLRSRTSSRNESLSRDETEQRRRMSEKRREDVDKSFKLGRFLAMEAPSSDRTPKIERFLVMSPSVAGEFEGRPVSGTEIEIESQYGEREHTEEDLLSEFDERGGDEEKEEGTSVQKGGFRGDDPVSGPDLEELETKDMSTPKQTYSFSPMQRLTDQVRGFPVEGSRPDVETHGDPNDNPDENDYDQVAAYLESSHEPENDQDESLPNSNDDNQLKPPDQNETGELLSPTVYTPTSGKFSRSPKIPDLKPLQTGNGSLSDEDNKAVKIDSPDTPVATNWARTSSLKHPRPQRQRASLNFTPLESQSTQPGSPWAATSYSSPVASTFASGAASPDPTAAEAVDANETRAPNGTKDQYADPPSPLKSHAASPKIDLKSGKRSGPPSIDTLSSKSQGRITSMASITSAGEDVLAAWAALGGSDNVAFNKRKRNR